MECLGITCPLSLILICAMTRNISSVLSTKHVCPKFETGSSEAVIDEEATVDPHLQVF